MAPDGHFRARIFEMLAGSSIEDDAFAGIDHIPQFPAGGDGLGSRVSGPIDTDASTLIRTLVDARAGTGVCAGVGLGADASAGANGGDHDDDIYGSGPNVLARRAPPVTINKTSLPALLLASQLERLPPPGSSLARSVCPFQGLPVAGFIRVNIAHSLLHGRNHVKLFEELSFSICLANALRVLRVEYLGWVDLLTAVSRCPRGAPRFWPDAAVTGITHLPPGFDVRQVRKPSERACFPSSFDRPGCPDVQGHFRRMSMRPAFGQAFASVHSGNRATMTASPPCSMTEVRPDTVIFDKTPAVSSPVPFECRLPCAHARLALTPDSYICLRVLRRPARPFALLEHRHRDRSISDHTFGRMAPASRQPGLLSRRTVRSAAP
ncbi:hypothetical protein H696_03372 [Fonticula alba]|uniref:Uncharacterized protein n=1 Tax=Fonticula alba TaxID=691883 RepID=A0A058Z6L9_FONAL|nr:hypothetical protein H696_03372 [Fonticula alba]KCV69905.1 hypothetical protein H696_03372 [Fonticula alba]|eukprot:XP_009495511.1 hypothetical protein H696_03372 [Fonticula alba]